MFRSRRRTLSFCEEIALSLFGELKRRNVIRVAATYMIASWLIIQVVSTIETPLSLPEWFDTVVVVLLALGFPIALLITWAFELTPEGIKASRPSTTNKAEQFRIIDYVLVVFLFLMISVTVWNRTPTLTTTTEMTANPSVTSIPTDKSIAVLPFADMSPGGNQEYFGDGIAEELLNEFTRLEGLRVASRTSSFSFKDTNATAGEIGESLNVSLILEGSVRTDANRLRITAQLIDVSNEYHHWSETYDRELNDIFSIQEEISAAVAGVLGVTLGVGDVNSFRGAGTDNIRAYSTYLRAIHSSPSTANETSALLQQAIDLDPDYGAAIAALGLEIATTMWTNPVEQAPQILDRSIEYLNRAVEINPDSAYAYTLQATANYGLFNFIDSEDYYTRALTIDQDGENIQHYGNMLMRTGKSSAALRYYDLAYSAEKHPVPVQRLGLNAHLARGNYDDALQLIEQLAEADKPLAGYYLAINQGNSVQLRAALDSLQSEQPLTHRHLTPVLDAIDSPETAVDRLISMFENADASWPSKYQHTAMLAAYLGEPEFALEVFATEVRLTTIRYGTLWYPVMAEVRQLPAFKELMTEINLVEYWRAHGWPDLCRPMGNDDFECL